VAFLHHLRESFYAFDNPEGDRIAVMFDQGIENGRLRQNWVRIR
jgi:hypothetical protein